MSRLSTYGISRSSAQRRWLVIALWIVALLVAGYSTATFLDDALTADFENLSNQESVVGLELLEERMDYDDPERETIVVNSEGTPVDDPMFAEVVNGIVADLRASTDYVDPDGVLNYFELVDTGNAEDADLAAQLVSDDRLTLIIPVTLVGTLDDTQDHIEDYTAILEQRSTDQITALSVGSMTINDTFNTISEEDLQTGEAFGIPIALIILIIVFGALIAAFVPIVLALVAIAVAVGMAAFVGNFRDLSFFITNMITTIGLAVGIDYSLFVIYRYREERRNGRSKLDAISETGGTASKAVFFSGLTVVFALLGLFIVPNSIFYSLGLGAVLVVIVAVIAVLTLIPAIVSLLGNKLDWPRKPNYDAAAPPASEVLEIEYTGFWGRMTKIVMDHPIPAVIGAGGLLLLLAIPYFDMETGIEGIERMPPSDVKTAYLILDEKFAVGRLSPVDIVVDGQNTDDINASIDALVATVGADPRVADVGETVWSSNDDLAHIQATLDVDANSDEAYALVNDLRETMIPAAFDGTSAEVYVTGDTASNQDFFDLVDQRTPWVFAFVLGLSFILLTDRLPLDRGAGDGDRDESPVGGRGVWLARAGVPEGVWSGFLRFHRVAHDRGLVTVVPLLRALRLVDGLPGLPAFAHPGVL